MAEAGAGTARPQAGFAQLPPWLRRGLVDLFPAGAGDAAADPDQSLAARLEEASRRAVPFG